jgi:hypothetical protein
VFSNELFPQTAPPDNSTVIGAAEVGGLITTKDISTFFFPNVYLFENGNPNDCCVLGFHGIDEEPGDASNGNLVRFFVVNYSSWISPGLFRGGFRDVTAHSHEIAETFNDPFVGFDGIHNITPFWLNPAGQCQDIGGGRDRRSATSDLSGDDRRIHISSADGGAVALVRVPIAFERDSRRLQLSRRDRAHCTVGSATI